MTYSRFWSARSKPRRSPTFTLPAIAPMVGSASGATSLRIADGSTMESASTTTTIGASVSLKACASAAALPAFACWTIRTRGSLAAAARASSAVASVDPSSTTTTSSDFTSDRRSAAIAGPIPFASLCAGTSTAIFISGSIARGARRGSASAPMTRISRTSRSPTAIPLSTPMASLVQITTRTAAARTAVAAVESGYTTPPAGTPAMVLAGTSVRPSARACWSAADAPAGSRITTSESRPAPGVEGTTGTRPRSSARCARTAPAVSGTSCSSRDEA